MYHVYPAWEEDRHVLDRWYGEGTCPCGAVLEQGIVVHECFSPRSLDDARRLERHSAS